MASEYLNNKNFESIIQAFQFYKRQKRKYELVVSDLQQTHDRRRKKHKDNCKKAALENSKQLHEESCDNYKDYQEQLAHAFYILSQNIANWAKFSGIDIDDAIQEGVLICFEKIDRFDPRKGKAFNYMSTCILNHFRQLYRSARNYNELKKRYHTFLRERFENVFYMNGKEKMGNARSNIDFNANLW